MYKEIISRKIFLLFIAILLSLYCLFYIKYSVNNLLYQKNELQRFIYKEKDNIRVLYSELAVLKNPNRIKKIAQNHLSIVETNPNQIILNENENIVQIKNNSKSSAKASWRYKKFNNQ